MAMGATLRRAKGLLRKEEGLTSLSANSGTLAYMFSFGILRYVQYPCGQVKWIYGLLFLFEPNQPYKKMEMDHTTNYTSAKQ